MNESYPGSRCIIGSGSNRGENRPMASDRDPRRFGGLSEAEAMSRLASEGPNELPSTRRRSLAVLAAEILKEPMILLLLACGGVYVLLGDREEALVLLASVFGVVGLSLYQSRKTERALDALRDLSSPRALVVRDGQERRIPGREVVPGDLVVLAEGDRVPADGVLLHAMSLSADESLLTGESVPVTKLANESAAETGRPGGDGLPHVWSGTLVVRGQGVARVSATGPKTELGKIGKPLQTQTARWVRVLAAAGLALCALLALAFGFFRGGWLEGLLAGLALAMALVPEEFPVILTVFLALGAWRISRRHVLARRSAAIEALGSATVLCVDKTGTLTQNRMAVAALEASGRTWDVANRGGEPLPETFHPLVEFALLAIRQKPFDPMERAVEALAKDALAGTEHLHGGWTLVHEYPLGHELLAVTHVWEPDRGGPRVVAAKGAPEAVADLCHLPAAPAQALLAAVAQFAERGLRVLAVARATAPPGALPPSAHDLTFECLGLVCLADPLRPGVADAVTECERAGVRTVMITGDYPGTARAIAAGAGLPSGDVLTGPELDALDDAALSSRVRGTRVFARVVPEQKLRLVKALKANGEVVAMTGDGVNDAPALKAAHIGIAMGGRGTDVAREASALVLLDDDYSSIVAAIRLGRRIFENIRKAMAYVLSVHVPIAGAALVPALVGWPLVLLPVHIVLLELVIDPACSIAFEAEPEDPGLMRRPPRDPKEPLLPARIVVRALLDGVLALIAVLGIAAFSVARGDAEGRTRALAFSTLLLLNLGLILTHRSTGLTMVASLRTPNPAIWWVLGGAIGVLGLCLGIEPMRELLRFGPLSAADVALAAGAGVGGLAGFELLKRAGRKSDASASSTSRGPVGA